MSTATTSETVQIYRVYIRATPEAIWEAVTKPEWTVQYGYAPL
ncbi:MAG: transcriptional regulator, partial [Acidimicrobiales bacterium]